METENGPVYYGTEYITFCSIISPLCSFKKTLNVLKYLCHKLIIWACFREGAHFCPLPSAYIHYRVMPPRVTAPKHMPAQPRSHAPTSLRPLVGSSDIVLTEALVAVKRVKWRARHGNIYKVWDSTDNNR